MRYKEFGKTGERLSVLCMGTWVLGGKNFGSVPESDAIAAVHAMVNNGVNFIDTAPIYAAGGSEEVLGKALKGGYRQKVFLVSKFGSEFIDPNDTLKGTVKNSSRANMLKSIDSTMARLHTDYLDGYLMHWPDGIGTPLEETIDCMKGLKAAGKVRFLGMSNLEIDLADKLLTAGVLDIVQYPYSMVDRRKEELLKHYSTAGCGTMGYASLGGGMLTGAFRELPKFDPGDMRNAFYGPMFKEPGFFQIQELLKVMDDISAAHDYVSLAQIAINWCLSHDYMHSSLTGVRNVSEADENCAAADWELGADELSALDDAIARLSIY